jgi:hypothetical protein
MPVIPTYQAKKDISGGSFLSEQKIVGPQPIDLSQFANSIGSAANTYIDKEQRKKAEEESLWVIQQSAQLQEKTITDISEQKLNAQDGAPNFTETAKKTFSDSAVKALNSAPSLAAQRELEKNVLEQKLSLVNEAVSFEATARVEKQILDVTKTAEMLTSQTFHRPQDLERNLTKLDSLTVLLPVGTRQKLSIQLRNQLGEAALTGRLQKATTIADLGTQLQEYQKIYGELESGKWNKHVPSDSLISFTGNTVTGIDGVKRLIKEEQDQAVRYKNQQVSALLDDHFAQLQATGQSNLVSRENIKLISEHNHDPQMLTDFDSNTYIARQVFGFMQALDKNDPVSAVAKIEALKPKKDSKSFANEQRVYEKVKELFSAHVSKVIHDPAGLAATSGKIQSEYKKGTQSGVLASVSAQQGYGLSLSQTRITSKKQAEEMVATINKLPAEQVEGYLQNMKQQYNFNLAPGVSAYGKLYGELSGSGLNPLYSIIGASLGQSFTPDLINAVKLGRTVLDKQLPTGTSSKIVQDLAYNAMATFEKAVSVGGTRPKNMLDIKEAITLLAEYRMSTGTKDASKAVNQAYKELIGDRYHIKLNHKNGAYPLVIPKTVDGKPVDVDRAGKALTSITPQQILTWFGASYQSPFSQTYPQTGKFGEDRPGHKHGGVDYAAPLGTGIRPVTPGRVTFVGQQSGYGMLVEVTHKDGSKSKYAHLSSANVKVNDNVDYTSLIGKVGSTGNSTGPHLHLEIINPKGERIDPNSVINKPMLDSSNPALSGVAINAQTAKAAAERPVWVLNSAGTGVNLAVDRGPEGIIELRNHKGQRYGVNFANYIGK